MKTEQADRFNDGKLRWGLVDWKSMEDFVKVLMMGAEKYDDHNWKKGLPVSEIIESLLRHTFALSSGETLDKESGLPHWGHMMCNVMFIAYMFREKPEFVDILEKLPKIPASLSSEIDYEASREKAKKIFREDTNFTKTLYKKPKLAPRHLHGEEKI